METALDFVQRCVCFLSNVHYVYYSLFCQMDTGISSDSSVVVEVSAFEGVTLQYNVDFISLC